MRTIVSRLRKNCPRGRRGEGWAMSGQSIIVGREGRGGGSGGVLEEDLCGEKTLVNCRT